MTQSRMAEIRRKPDSAVQLDASVIEGFCSTLLQKGYDDPTPTPSFHRELWELCTAPHRYVAIAAPRGHGKSTAVTGAYALAEMLFRTSAYAVIVSSTFSIAAQLLGDIRRELQVNEDLRALFQVADIPKDTEDDIIVTFKDGKSFRIQARGSGQKLRGLKWNGRRPDLIIGDDMEDDEQVMSKERREVFHRWVFSALLPILAPKGKVRFVGTILHADSLLARLMPSHLLTGPVRDRLVTEPLKEWTPHPVGWRSVKYRAHDDDFSHVLWPERMPADHLRALRDKAKEQGVIDSYYQEYLNIPLDESHGYFRRADFRPASAEDSKRRLSYYIACDLAVSTKARSDYTVFVVGGLDEFGILHIRKVLRDRLDPLQIVETVIALQRLYEPKLFGIEQGLIQNAIGPYLDQAQIKSGVFINLFPLRPAADKIYRASSISARMRAGGVRFDRESDWYADFEHELLGFPRLRHDDQVDAFAYLGLMLNRMDEAPTDEEVEQEEYEVEAREQLTVGRSSITGY